MIALKAKGTYPDLGSEIDDAKGIEDGAACSATQGRVRKYGHTGEMLDRSVDGGDRDDAVDGFLLSAWDHIPGHSNAVLRF